MLDYGSVLIAKRAGCQFEEEVADIHVYKVMRKGVLFANIQAGRLVALDGTDICSVTPIYPRIPPGIDYFERQRIHEEETDRFFMFLDSFDESLEESG